MSTKLLVVQREETEPHVRIAECIPLVERAYTALIEGQAELPSKYHYGGAFGMWFFMGGQIPSLGAMAIKLGCAPPGRGSCQVIYYDHETAEPLALMEGLWVTHLRTGAAAAIGAKYLARPEAKTVAIVGTGRVGWFSLGALSECFALEKAYAADISADSRQVFAKRAKDRFAFPVVEAQIEEAVRSADIVVTATPARAPMVKAEWVRPGTHVSAMGADGRGKQELESGVHQKARIVVDRTEQCVQWGDINNSCRAGLVEESQIAGEIGEVILGRKQGRTSAADITLFDSTGMGIQDAAVAGLIYRTAVEHKLGTWVEL